MNRAAICIGVDRSGPLPVLGDAAEGARRMHAWATAAAGIAPEQALLITDDGGRKVTPDAIADAIDALLAGPGLDQLIVYFAGHGVYNDRTEHWLLSEAPTRASAAVNVAGSMELAGFCNAQHVVMISDACRVAPEGIQAQRVSGIDVFPNLEPEGRRKPVTQFYACRLGRPAAEIRDPALAGRYHALYSGALLEALQGKVPAVLEPGIGPDAGHAWLRLPRLANHLESELPRRIKAAGLLGQVSQMPEVLPAGPVMDAWLARFDLAALATPGATATAGPTRGAQPRAIAIGGLDAPDPLKRTVRAMVRSAARADAQGLEAADAAARSGVAEPPRAWVGEVQRLARGFGPDHFETRCGLKLQGARARAAWAAGGAQAELLDGGALIRLHGLAETACSVLLELDDGRALVVAAYRDFLAALRFDAGAGGAPELVDVAHEPSAQSPFHAEFQAREAEIRHLHAVAAAASREGRFRLDGDDAAALAQRMHMSRAADPSLAVYAAWAYRDLQDDERLQAQARWLRSLHGLLPFDVALLSGALRGRVADREAQVVPCVPQLLQGWALLNAHRVKLAAGLARLAEHREGSLWTMFDAGGLALLRRAFQQGEVR